MAPMQRRVVSNPGVEDDVRAARDGMTHQRDLFQLRRLLPFEERSPVATRAFVPRSRDESAWIATNNRAFAQHPDQSSMTSQRLAAELAQPWFDPEGFLLHEIDGRIAAFCWTKRHPAGDVDPAMGEIYVIGVDPEFQGRGLGRALVVAGLDWLVSKGEHIAMLYVDADNATARGLYDSLGFSVHHLDRVYEPRNARSAHP